MDIFGITLSDRDLWLLGWVSLLLGWLVSLSPSKENVARRRAAGDAIATAFRAELTAILQTNDDIGAHILTETAFKKHEAVILNNIGGLSWLQQLRLRLAWRKLAYHEEDKKQKIPYYDRYVDGGSINERNIVRPLVIARLKRVIASVS